MITICICSCRLIFNDVPALTLDLGRQYHCNRTPSSGPSRSCYNWTPFLILALWLNSSCRSAVVPAHARIPLHQHRSRQHLLQQTGLHQQSERYLVFAIARANHNPKIHKITGQPTKSSGELDVQIRHELFNSWELKKTNKYTSPLITWSWKIESLC